MRNIIVLLSIKLLLLSSVCHSQWVVLNSGTGQNLNSIHFLNQLTGYAAGNSGTIIKTINGGLNWSVLNTGTSVELRSVFVLNTTTILACGFSGTILKTSNGGDNWNIVNSGTTNHLLGISFINDLSGICCGNSGIHLYTTNGGSNWAIGYPTGYLVTFYSAFMADASNGYCVGVNTIFSPLVAKTTNGGANWSYYAFMVNNNEATLRDVHFFDVQNGIAVSNLWNGQGGISRTSNGGANWAGHQILTYGLFGLDFTGSQTGYTVGNMGSILKTTDSGYNWFTQTSNTSAALMCVDFLDSLYGYAAGSGGIILKTTNGGIVGIKQVSSNVPFGFKLYQNYPNPFNPVTKIKFDIPAAEKRQAFSLQEVQLKVYNTLGQEIATLVNEQLKPGTYKVEFDGTYLSNGVYYYQLKITDPSASVRFIKTKTMILIK
jgi:photosystem II stability/assembly factor-like uncharacterized protein